MTSSKVPPGSVFVVTSKPSLSGSSIAIDGHSPTILTTFELNDEGRTSKVEISMPATMMTTLSVDSDANVRKGGGDEAFGGPFAEAPFTDWEDGPDSGVSSLTMVAAAAKASMGTCLSMPSGICGAIDVELFLRKLINNENATRCPCTEDVSSSSLKMAEEAKL